MALPAHRPLTYDDLVDLPDDGLRYEIIDGELYVTAAPSTKHQRVLGNLYYVIRIHLHEHPAGHLYFAPLDIVFNPINVVEPDLLFISNARAEVLTEKNVQGAPDLLVEILSPSTRKVDETTKRGLYERMGVDEYWLADPDRETVRVFRRQGERFAPVADLAASRGEALTTPLLPGLEIPLAEVFS
jgi:Uma2 family endonuclease